MTNHQRAPFVDHPVACPFCGNALTEGQFHSCREMREDRPGRLPVQFRVTPAVANWLLAALAILVTAYLMAHLLVAAGVPCPTS